MLMKLIPSEHGKHEIPSSFADKDGYIMYPINILCKVLDFKIDSNIHLLYEVKSNDMKRKQFDDILAKSLNEREQQVLHLRYCDKTTCTKIGNMFGLSANRISQIEGKAIRKLRKGLFKIKQNPNDYFNIEPTKQVYGITDAVYRSFINKKKLKMEQEKKEERERQKKIKEKEYEKQKKLREEERERKKKLRELQYLKIHTREFDDYLIEEFPNGMPNEYNIRKIIYDRLQNKKHHIFNYIDEHPELLNEMADFCNPKNVDKDKINSLLSQMFIMYEQNKNSKNIKYLYEEYKEVFLKYCSYMYDTFLYNIEMYNESNAHISLEKDGIMYFYPENK